MVWTHHQPGSASAPAGIVGGVVPVRSRRRRIISPTATDPVKIAPTGTNPQSLWFATAARPADATQPQFAQSGVPPNWHGSMRVVKSADIVVVVRANTHSEGDSGGSA